MLEGRRFCIIFKRKEWSIIFSTRNLKYKLCRTDVIHVWYSCISFAGPQYTQKLVKKSVAFMVTAENKFDEFLFTVYLHLFLMRSVRQAGLYVATGTTTTWMVNYYYCLLFVIIVWPYYLNVSPTAVFILFFSINASAFPIIVMDLDLELGLEFAPPEKIPRKGEDTNFSDDEGEGKLWRISIIALGFCISSSSFGVVSRRVHCPISQHCNLRWTHS